MSYEDYSRLISQNSGYAPADTVYTDSLFGLNIFDKTTTVQPNTENYGYTFFTRPDLNLSYDNLQVDRVLSNLLMESPNGIQRAIRAYLDPQSHCFSSSPLQCDIVDRHNPFIPLLSNNILTITGWEDITLGTHTSEPGKYRDVYGYVDDVPYQFGSYDLQCSFRNIMGDPITYMMRMWIQYQGLVYEGRIMPHWHNILNYSMDYNTRIYRLVTDVSRTYVTRLFACGACFPINANIARYADLDATGNSSPFNGVTDTVNFVFRAYGFTNYDHILIYEFNELVERFNANMRDENRESMMIKLKSNEKEYFSRRSYPRINPATMELEWWISKVLHETGVTNIVKYNNSTEAVAQ